MNESLQNLVDIIFIRDPKPPCTYKIALPDDRQQNMFQLLMTLLICGARKLYGENITPSDISEYQFEELKRYIESVGYVIKYNYKDINNINSDENVNVDVNVDDNVDDNVNVDDNIGIKPRIINIWFEQYIPLIDCHGRPMLC